jgi:conjugal transfer mating pair stabilization protein TraG
MIKALLLFSLSIASVAFGDPIHTHGNGELLEQVFKAISKILYGDSSNKLEATFNALIKISLTVGAFSALLIAFFRQKFEPLIRSFLIPSLIIVGFLLIPRTSVEIVEASDPEKKRKPIEVPFFLGKFAAWTSYSFEGLHHLFKKAIGDNYPWTANIYEGKNFLKHRSVPFSDSAQEESFREFCRECVFRDLDLGLYTKKELGEAPDLLEFLATRTSEKRALFYKGQPLSCKDAFEEIKKSIESQSFEPIGQIDFLFGAPKNRLSFQKIAIDLLQEEIFRPDLKFQNKESWGALGAVAFMSLRSFFEAILYLLFPLIVLLSLLTFGLRTALLWIRSLIWVYSWPIFYLAIDLFLNALWKFRAADKALNLANGDQLAALYSSMEMIACACVASVPLLSWFMIKGGVSQLVHVSLPGPAKIDPPPIPEQLNHPPSWSDPQDASQQAHWAVLSREPAAPAEDGFKATVESAKKEERVDSLQSSLSSIRESVKDSSIHISKAVNVASPPVRNEPSNRSSSQVTPETSEKWGSAHMHIPPHGSWAAAENARGRDPQ